MTDLDRIEREVVIDAPVERVWTLLTAPEHVGTWFGDAGAEVDLRPGGALSLTWREFGTVRGRVERVEPQRVFAYRWAAGTDIEPAEGRSTLVEFSLAEEGGGTRVRVVESGFAGLNESEADRRHRFDDHTEGWQIELGHLAEHAGKVAARA